jgi:hypothetical protein
VLQSFAGGDAQNFVEMITNERKEMRDTQVF